MRLKHALVRSRLSPGGGSRIRSVPKLLTAAVVGCAVLASSDSALAAGWSKFCVLTRPQAHALIGRIVVREGSATERDCSYIGDPYGLNMVQAPASNMPMDRAPRGTRMIVLRGIGRDATLTTRALTRTPGVGAEVAFTIAMTRYELSLTVTRTSLSSRQVRLLVADSRRLARKLR